MKRNVLIGTVIAGALAVSGLAGAGSPVQPPHSGPVPFLTLPPGIPDDSLEGLLQICDDKFLLELFPSLAEVCEQLHAQEILGTFQSHLNGFNAVPPVNSPATGTLKLQVVGALTGNTATYDLDWQGLVGKVESASITFGATGGPLVFLCGGHGSPDCGKNGTDGTIRAENILPIPGQLVNAEDFHAFVNVLVHHKAYVRVTTVVNGKETITEIQGVIAPANPGEDEPEESVTSP